VIVVDTLLIVVSNTLIVYIKLFRYGSVSTSFFIEEVRSTVSLSFFDSFRTGAPV